MPENPLDYDKTIWQVFSVGIVSSVIILYYVVSKNIEKYNILALFLGFSILIYCFFLVRGYGKKKQILERIIRDHLPFRNEEYELMRTHLNRMRNECYFRVRWLGEIVLGIIIIYYFYIFYIIEAWSITIPLIVILLFAFLSCVANNLI